MKLSIRVFLVCSILTISMYNAVSQSNNKNLWRDHLPYNNCKAVSEAGELIYAATPYSLFYYNAEDQSLTRQNKVTADGLSDIGISSIGYCTALNTLVVAYSNTNIDLVKGSEVVNIPDIKLKQILGNKTINSILIIGKLAYMACGFGIVVLDIEKEEIKDTYYIGPSGSQIDVKALTFHSVDNKFYAATEKGIYSALSTENLAYYVNWVRESSITGPNDNFNLITSFSGKVYANKTKYSWDSDSMFVKNGNSWAYFIPADHANRTSMRVCGEKLVISNNWNVSVYLSDGTAEAFYTSYNPTTSVKPADAIFDKAGKLWIADYEQGLWSIGTDQAASNYVFNGPSSPTVSAMDISGRQLWAVPGGRTAGFGSIFRLPQYYTLADNTWKSYTWVTLPEIANFRDILCVAADPAKGDHAFLGSWGQGVIEMENGELKEIYTPANSTLQYIDGLGAGYLRIGGLAFDKNNNLWVTNSNASNILSRRKPTGEWKSFNLGSEGTGIDAGTLVIDHEDQKWIQRRDLALLVFNENYPPKKLTNAVGNGALPGTSIASMAVDLDGQLWLGSDQGVAVIS